ncbi:hypothetical protein Tco_1221199 [Tanacetum coccineum]
MARILPNTNNGNSSYPDRRQTLEESLTKFMVESAKRHEENSNIIKDIRASTDASIRNQGASIKTLEIQIGQMSKVLQERGIEGLSGSTEPNPRDHVKSISTSKSNSSAIRCIGSGPYAVSNAEYTLVDLGASVSVMPFSIYSNLGLDVFKRKITLRVGEEKLVFKSIKPATSIIRRVYMVKERTDLDSKTEFVGEAINESFDPLYGNYIELNDLDMPLEPRMNQDDFEPTLDFINEPTYKSCYKMKFSCMIGYRHVNADFLPSLSINIMTKRFYNSIIKDKGDHEAKNLAGTLIDIPIFVGNFYIISGFSITDDVDITRGVVGNRTISKDKLLYSAFDTTYGPDPIQRIADELDLEVEIDFTWFASNLSSVYYLVEFLNFSPEVVELWACIAASPSEVSVLLDLKGCSVMPFLRVFGHFLDGYFCISSSFSGNDFRVKDLSGGNIEPIIKQDYFLHISQIVLGTFHQEFFKSFPGSEKAFVWVSQFVIEPDGSFLSQRLAAPVKDMGKARSIT